MSGILLTQNTTFLIGDVARVLGWIFNVIFNFLDGVFGIQNIGLCIILFTIIIYMIMLPLTIKQQKFSKLSSKMNPEVMAIQKKYKNKKDQDSIMKMNEETKAVYERYGTSPTGGCLQLIIQMPILLSLYQVIYKVPGYVEGVRSIFDNLVASIMNTNGFEKIIETFIKDNKLAGVTLNTSSVEMTQNTIVDTLYKLQSSGWENLADKFPELSNSVYSTAESLAHMNNFLGINIANSPSTILKSAFAAGAVLTVIGALSIPLLAGLTQWINTKLMPQPQAQAGAENNPMANSMKSMNVMMPIMSAVFCFTLPAGMGLYWIAGAVIRSVQQFLVNRHLNKMDLDDIIKKNIEKANKKREKKGLPPQKVSNIARANVRNIEEQSKKEISSGETEEKVKKSTDYYKSTANAKPGSLASKAGMVKQYNEKSKK